MVADQPLDHLTLAAAVGYPPGEVRRRWPRSPRSTPSRAAGSTCATSPAAGATTPARTSPPVVERFVLDGQQARLTQAALETLAVVAYRQPVSRARVSAIRGVNVDGVMRTLLTRGPGRGGRARRRDRRDALPHDGLLPRAHRRRPRSTTCPSWRRSCRRWTTSTTSTSCRGAPRARRPTRRGRLTAVDGERTRARRRRAGPAAEAARPVRGGQPAQVRGADARRPGRGRRRGRHPARHQGRPAHRRDPRRRQAAAAGERRTSTWC